LKLWNTGHPATTLTACILPSVLDASKARCLHDLLWLNLLYVGSVVECSHKRTDAIMSFVLVNTEALNHNAIK